MPQPFPDPVSGLTQGLMQGFQLAQQAKMQEQQQKSQQIDQAMKGINEIGTLMANPNLPESYVKQLMPSFVQHVNTFNQITGGEPIQWDGAIDSSTRKHVKMAAGLVKDSLEGKIPVEHLPAAIRGWVQDVHNTSNPKVGEQVLNQAGENIYGLLHDPQTTEAQKTPLESSLAQVSQPHYEKYLTEKKAQGGDHYTIQSKTNPDDVKSIRLQPGQGIPNGYKIISAGAGESMQLAPETLQALATRFGASGEIPGMGMGKAATEARTKVLNTWAEDLKKTATTPEEQLAKQATYKASVQELKRLQGQRGVVMSFANTAEKNLGLVSDLSEKVDRTGIPVINRWLLAGKKSLAGDPDVAKLDAAVRTAINEYARVTSSATGGGVTSDQARKEVESMLSSAQTKEQMKEVIKLLRQEMGNRKAGYDQQIETIKNGIAGGGAKTEGPTQSTSKEDLYKKYNLKLRVP